MAARLHQQQHQQQLNKEVKMNLGLLHTILSDITGHKPAPIQAPQKPDNTPSLAQFTQAMLNVKPQDLPQDNLDGTFKNLQPGKGAVIQSGGTWQPPLLPGRTTPKGAPYYTPLAGSAGEYNNSGYYAIPINPDAIPKPQPLLKPMLPGGNY